MRLAATKVLCYAIQKSNHINDTLVLWCKGLTLQVARDRPLINGVDQCHCVISGTTLHNPMLERGITSATADQHLKLLRHALSLAANRGVVDENSAAVVLRVRSTKVAPAAQPLFAQKGPVISRVNL